MIGIAFSLGFTVGPLLGAFFAISSKASDNVFYQTPALLALAFSVCDLLFIWLMLPETLTVDVKVGYKTLHFVFLGYFLPMRVRVQECRTEVGLSYCILGMSTFVS